MSTVSSLLAILLIAIFSVLSLLHVYWGFGGKWGSTAVIPTNVSSKPAMQPGIVSCLVVAVALFGVAGFVAIKAQWLPFKLPEWLLNYGCWMAAGVFFLRAIGDGKYVGFFKKIRHTTFAQNDTRYFSPLCIAIGLLFIGFQYGLGN